MVPALHTRNGLNRTELGVHRNPLSIGTMGSLVLRRALMSQELHAPNEIKMAGLGVRMDPLGIDASSHATDTNLSVLHVGALRRRLQTTDGVSSYLGEAPPLLTFELPAFKMARMEFDLSVMLQPL